MTNLESIAVLFQQIDNYLEELREKHDAAGREAERDGVEHQQILNEQALFVLAWGQLEADIDDACRAAIEIGISHDDWRQRRTWIVYNEDIERLSFRKRLTLVLDRSSYEWQKSMENQEFRNKIAHGEILDTSIDLPNMIEDFRRIQSALVRE